MIAAHDDLTALYAVLCNSFCSESGENITIETVNASLYLSAVNHESKCYLSCFVVPWTVTINS